MKFSLTFRRNVANQGIQLTTIEALGKVYGYAKNKL